MADQQHEHRQQEDGAGQRQEDPKIQSVQRFDIADQTGQHIAGVAETEAPG